MLRDGLDPSREKRAVKTAARERAVNTFIALGRELLDKKRADGCAPATMRKMEHLLGMTAPTFGERSIAEIKAPEILAALRRIEQRGAYNTAHRLRAFASETFCMAIATGRASDDPAHALRVALIKPKAQKRAAIVEAKPFGELLRAIDGLEGGMPETKLALRLLCRWFSRAPPSFIKPNGRSSDFDADQPTWTIPAAKMKLRKHEHRVPLSLQAVAILRELAAIARGSKFVFPNGRTLRAT